MQAADKTLAQARDVAPVSMGQALPCVLGGLTIMRCFSLAGIPYIAVSATGDPRDRATFAARLCHRGFVTADPKLDPRKTMDDLIAIGKTLSHPAPLYYSNDQTLRLVSENRDELRKYYRFQMPDHETIADTLDKSRFIDFCRRFGIQSPESFSSTEVAEKVAQGYDWPLPMIFKPTSHVHWFTSQLIRDLGGLNHKGLICYTKAQFDHALERLTKEGIPFLLQQFIPGGDENIHSFHAFFDEDSRPLGYFAGKKLRTFPPGTGESTFLELVHNEELCRIGTDIMQRTKFSGPVKMDFKRNPLDGKYYLLEINARSNLWQYMGAKSGLNLPVISYNYFTGNRSREVQTHHRTSVRWMHARYDVRAFFAYRRSGELTLWQYLRSLMHPKIYSKFSWRDPLPSLYAVWIFFSSRLPFGS